jgi:hypothetical protein
MTNGTIKAMQKAARVGPRKNKKYLFNDFSKTGPLY